MRSYCSFRHIHTEAYLLWYGTFSGKLERIKISSFLSLLYEWSQAISKWEMIMKEKRSERNAMWYLPRWHLKTCFLRKNLHWRSHFSVFFFRKFAKSWMCFIGWYCDPLIAQCKYGSIREAATLIYPETQCGTSLSWRNSWWKHILSK